MRAAYAFEAAETYSVILNLRKIHHDGLNVSDGVDAPQDHRNADELLAILEQHPSHKTHSSVLHNGGQYEHVNAGGGGRSMELYVHVCLHEFYVHNRY